MKSAKLTTALTITMIVLVAFTSSGAMAQEFGAAPAPSPSMESAGMALPVPAILAAVVSLGSYVELCFCWEWDKYNTSAVLELFFDHQQVQN
ncbi:hypothetical protein L6452_35915 [Arctium lappa]|uniref:Uncharacterized protein n=1 Tax=Arctium lappa TaxID=4217 RepID=A0ACB8Y7U9_ARCLA|nr:hypothetical protein L6452_35915 [Arctium lappa]